MQEEHFSMLAVVITDLEQEWLGKALSSSTNLRLPTPAIALRADIRI